jgi:hypothetical protein
VHPHVLAEYDRFMQSRGERRRLWFHFMRLRFARRARIHK